MPRKKTVVPDEEPMEVQTAAEASGEENTGQFPEAAPGEEGAGEIVSADGEAPLDGLPADPPAGEEVSSDVPPDGETPDAAEASFPGEVGGEPAVGEELYDGSNPDHMPPGGDFLTGAESPFPEADDPAYIQQPQEGMEPESDDPEYGGAAPGTG